MKTFRKTFSCLLKKVLMISAILAGISVLQTQAMTSSEEIKQTQLLDENNNTLNQESTTKIIDIFNNRFNDRDTHNAYIASLQNLYIWVFKGNNTKENLELVKTAYKAYTQKTFVSHIQKNAQIEKQYNEICNKIEAKIAAQEQILNGDQGDNDDNDGEVTAGMSKSSLQKLNEVKNFLNGDKETAGINKLIEKNPSGYNSYIVGIFRKKTKKLSDDLTSLINNFNKAYNLFKKNLEDQKNINDSTLKQKEIDIINKLHKAVYNIHTLLIVPFDEITITENHPAEENHDELFSFFKEEIKLKSLNSNIENATQACKDFVNHIIKLANKHQVRHDISYTPNNKTYDVPEDYQNKFFAICYKMHKAKASSWFVRHKKLLIGGTIVTVVLVGSGAAIYYVIIPQWGLIYSTMASSIASIWNYIMGTKAAAEVAEVTPSIWDSSIAQFLRRIARPDKYIMRFFKRN